MFLVGPFRGEVVTVGWAGARMLAPDPPCPLVYKFLLIALSNKLCRISWDDEAINAAFVGSQPLGQRVRARYLCLSGCRLRNKEHEACILYIRGCLSVHGYAVKRRWPRLWTGYWLGGQRLSFPRSPGYRRPSLCRHPTGVRHYRLSGPRAICAVFRLTPSLDIFSPDCLSSTLKCKSWVPRPDNPPLPGVFLHISSTIGRCQNSAQGILKSR
ncbi:hypothetical protein B0T26DRAFT_312398 [Lasiosphaeria miniovina]|uniref:Uncharacterized protein n=1 Tax=Lasiosphaeria miniovina TaxID=1954250 RepID=A0AA40ALN2_9PEZI|nr:uncharacterized protein B0T26DRAFT_312398 [Lasiosphaeria miniovina]KAK0718089.1 hypothetical protein B0T26DRAFT_312398 [Lasiosphaeria miniovina]